MRFGAHQTFHLRDAWLHKGLFAVSNSPTIFSSEAAVEDLGLGKNMVDSLRYWLEATQLVVKEGNDFHLTEIAAMIQEGDPYLELDGTIQLIHYLLCSNDEDATVWFWFFNKFAASEFDFESLNLYLQSFVKEKTTKKINENTLNKDLNCLIRMYRNKEFEERQNPETESPSPFLKFRFLEQTETKIKRRSLFADEISPHIFAFCLYLFWIDHLQEVESLSLEDVAQREFSPGLIFGLSLEECAQMIEKLSQLQSFNYLEFSKTGGYFIIHLNRKFVEKGLKNYYLKNKQLVD